MSSEQTHKRNHYVPRSYLKRWTDPAGKLWVYRVLVSHANFPLWTAKSVGGIAYHEHLYTRIAAGEESDEFERWLDREFETPAQDALYRATTGARLTAAHWRVLVRFLAAQDLRTPARFLDSVQRWEQTLPSLLQETLEQSVRRFEELSESEIAAMPIKPPEWSDSPFRTRVESDPSGSGGILRLEATIGRKLWLYETRMLLTGLVDRLSDHRWTILTAPDDLPWPTTDDPVIRLNYHSADRYDFVGGWGSKGTEIFMPLGPRHLLFTQVGERPRPRGSVPERHVALGLRQLIVKHAHRFVFASHPDPSVEEIRPRLISANQLEQEAAEWANWHDKQTAAERKI